MRTVYALFRGVYEADYVECLFETEALARAAVERLNEDWGWGVKPLVLFDGTPTFVEHHKMNKHYASDGSEVICESTYHAVDRYISGGESEPEVPSRAAYYCCANGDRGIHVESHSRELCEAVCRHYSDKLHGLPEVDGFAELEWPDGVA